MASHRVQVWHPLEVDAALLRRLASALKLSFTANEHGLNLSDLQSPKVISDQLLMQQHSENIDDIRTQGSYFINRFAWRLSLVIAAYDLACLSLDNLLEEFRWQAETVREQDKGEWYDYVDFSFSINSIPAPTQQKTEQEMADLFVQIFQPIVNSLRQQARLSVNAVWSLVTDAVAAVYLYIGREMLIETAARQRVELILKLAPKPLANNRWHFKNYSVPASHSPTGKTLEQWLRVRSGCCRYYTLDKGEYCTTCIHVKEPEREQRFTNYLILNAIN